MTNDGVWEVLDPDSDNEASAAATPCMGSERLRNSPDLFPGWMFVKRD